MENKTNTLALVDALRRTRETLETLLTCNHCAACEYCNSHKIARLEITAIDAALALKSEELEDTRPADWTERIER
jgi:hypothetical protein